MATPMVLTAAYVNVGSNLLNDYCSKVEITVDVEDKDVTTFTSGGWKALLGGLKSSQIALTFKNDVTAGDLDSILWPLLGTVATFDVRATSAAASTSNPKYTGSLLVKTLMPIAGNVGDVNEQSVTWPTSGTVTRGTS